MSVIVGFDMGIRNLAYCAIEHSNPIRIVAWDNVDLLEGGVSAQDAKKCCACSGSAKFSGPDDRRWCNGCATGVRRKKSAVVVPGLSVLPCGMGVKELRTFLGGVGVDAKKMKKEELLEYVRARYLLPWKPVKAMGVSLNDIRRSMDSWLTGVLHVLARASIIRLENQPVMKGPTMKSVQIMLFTLLAHRLEKEYDWKGRIDFVHAGVKTKDAAPAPPSTDDGAAYRARKKTAETSVIEHLGRLGMKEWLTYFESRTKKSDLADAFLMALNNPA
jgi:hypothetical protein